VGRHNLGALGLRSRRFPARRDLTCIERAARRPPDGTRDRLACRHNGDRSAARS
jgi:hypothetical protein